LCVRVALPGFVVPYMIVYDPALALQSSDPLAIAYVAFKALVAVGLWGAAAIGFLRAPLSWPQRLLAAAAALLLVVALPITDEIGFALAAVFLAWHWRATRAAT
jgi:TRAP-type uncharacterized transport system fused permease subunit